MFVFSKEHFLKMLKVENGWRSSRLLDLGAGDGKPTEVMAGLFDEVFVTEMSKPMRKILNTKGFQVLEIADWQKDEYYEVIRYSSKTVIKNIYKEMFFPQLS